MNGAASGLIEAIKATYPDPNNTGTSWDQIPHGGTSWYKYGGGGIASWGTLCGIPNGCCALLNLIYNVPTLNSLADQVLYRYSRESYPPTGLYELSLAQNWSGLGITQIPYPDDDANPYPAHTVSDSPLCHVSISKWCLAANVKLTDPGAPALAWKMDRCGKICADMAAFTAELINGTPPTSYSMSSATAACYSCHNTTATSVIPAQCGKMECTECHTDLRAHGSAAIGYPPTVGHGAVTVTGWTASFSDASTDMDDAAGTLRVEVNWGDGGLSTGKDGDLFSHDYTAAGKYNITHSVQDPAGHFASEIIKVAVGLYSLTVNVKTDGSNPVAGATVYLKQKKGSGDWKQVMYGYTDGAGSKTFTDFPGGAVYLYKVVVYRSGLDFNTSATGTQTKVKSDPFPLNADTTVDIQQGAPPTVTIT